MTTDDAYRDALLRLLEVPSSPRLGLERMETLLTALGNPHLAVPTLHVAGTNGKGSTCALMVGALSAQQFSTGLFTSPHLVACTERIRLNQKPISRARFVELEARVHQAAAFMHDAPTFFERTAAMAFCAFADADVDVAVIEVGLGGRLDATNVVAPDACAITSIGLDHQAFLGDTLAAIAGEKAGILKPGVPAVSARQKKEAAHAIRMVADAKRVDVDFVDDDARVPTLTLAGEHQRMNAAVALAALERGGWVHDEAAARRGLAEATWPGRYEWIGDVLVDGAHNPASARALSRALKDDARAPGPVVLVLGATRGHETDAFLSAFDADVAHIVATKAGAPRSVAAADVAAAAAAKAPVTIEEPPGEALLVARAHAQKTDATVVVTGSLYLVGELRAALVGEPVDPLLPDF